MSWNKTIRNPVYKGLAQFGKRGTFKKGEKQIVRADSELITYPVPPIVSDATWVQAQARSESNKRLAERNSHREYLISGMIKCSCGYHMAAACKTRKLGETRYYRCNSRLGFARLEARHHHSVNADRAEQAAWEFLLEVVSERDKLYLRLKEAQAAALEKVSPQRDQLESVKAMLAEAEQDAERTAREMRAIPKSRRNGPTYKALEKQSLEIDERYGGLKRTGERLEAEITAATISDESIADFTLFSEDAIAGVNNPDYATKRRWLDYLKVSIVVKDKVATISCMLPVESRTFDLHTACTSSCPLMI